MRQIILIISFACFGGGVIAQQSASKFVIIGSVNADTGSAVLISVIDSSYYPNQKYYPEYPISKGSFRISGSSLYPYMFQLGIKVDGKLTYVSDFFFVDTGYQEIVCNIDSLRELPKIDNQSMSEFRSSFSSAYASIWQKRGHLNFLYDSVNKIYAGKIPTERRTWFANERNSLKIAAREVLISYVRQHPSSYIGLWTILSEMQKGYDHNLDSAYDFLSPNLKSTVTGKNLSRSLDQQRVTAIGATFPDLLLKDKKLNGVAFVTKSLNRSFTYIDFWYSHCGPYISQFGDLKRIYNHYAGKGLEIIGISTDLSKDVEDWRKVIADYSLPWPEYVDLNHTIADKLGIFGYPSSFLCDNTGKIVQVNLQPGQLEAFLKEKLGSQ